MNQSTNETIKEAYMSNPEDPQYAADYADYLYSVADYRTLESFFKERLMGTYNVRLFCLYLTYIGNMNASHFGSAFEFVFDRLSFHYDFYEVFCMISGIDLTVEKKRMYYQKVLKNPMHKMNVIFKEYESWELGLNRVTGNAIMSEQLVTYQDSFKKYQQLLPYIKEMEFENMYKMIEIEYPNESVGLGGEEQKERFKKVILMLMERFYYKEEVYFLYCTLVSLDEQVLLKGIRITNSPFLKLYYSFCFSKTNFIEGDTTNELFVLHMLNIKGKESCEEMLKYMESVDCMDKFESALVYAARLYYVLTGDKKGSVEMFERGSSRAAEECLRFLIEIGDVEGARLLYTKYKTDVMSSLMCGYELLYGSYDGFKSVMNGRIERLVSRDVRTSSVGRCNRRLNGVNWVEQLYIDSKNSFSFMDVEVADDFNINTFIEKIPRLKSNSLFNGMKSSDILNILKGSIVC